MIPRACRTCGEPLQESGGPGCGCGTDGVGGAGGAGGAESGARERPLVRPYVMKAPGPVGGWDDGEGDGPGGPPPHGAAGPDGGPPDAGGPGPDPVAYGATAGGAPGSAPGTPGSVPGAPGGPGGPLPGSPPADGAPAAPYGPIGAAPEGPADADLGLFADGPAAARGASRDAYDDYDANDADGPGDPYGAHRSRGRLAARRRRRLTLVLTVGGVVAALSVGLLGSGLFSGDGDEDRAVPKPDTITAVPTGGGTRPGPDDSHSGAPSAPADGDDPAEPSPTGSGGTGTEAGDPDGAPTGRTEAGQVTAAPPDSDTGSGADPTAPGGPTPGTTPDDGDTPAPPPTLREGDTGPEVVEMQKRLIEADYNLLGGTDGEFDFFTRKAVERFQRDNDIEGDASGVYGPATRRALESMTEEP